MDPLDSTSPPPGEPSRPALLFIFLAGVFLVVSAMGFFLYLADRWPEPYAHVYKLIAAHLFSGRAGNAAIGVKMDFPNWFLLYQSCVVDFALMFILYPAFVLGYRTFNSVPLIGTTLARIHESALEHRDRIKPYGVAGLLLFVLIPIWSTGPLVGVVVGYLIGLSPVLTFSTVMIANTASVAASVAAYVWAYDWVNAYNSTLGWVLLGVILVVFLGGSLYGKLRKRPSLRPQSQVEAD
jgi:uncharacterized membrane protein